MPSPTSVLTVSNLVAETLSRNPEIRFYEAEIQAARAGRRSAGALSNPELAVAGGHKSTSSSGFSTEGVAWSVTLTQPFEWPGRVGLRKAIANQDIELARLGVERFRNTLAGRVRLLAFGLHAAREKAAAAGDVAARLSDLRQVLVQRDPAGLTPLLETRVIEATELTVLKRSTDAALELNTALRELNQLRGVAMDSQTTVAPVRLKFLPGLPVASLQDAARTNNFELRLRVVELRQQGFRVDLARNERRPTIHIGPTFSEERSGHDREQIIGLAVSLPLPIWNRNKPDVEIATARRLQAETILRTAEREVLRMVGDAAGAYEARVAVLTGWRPDAAAHFKDAAELADRHYRLGAVPISTYVELQKQYLEAVESLMETELHALEAALELESLTGLSLGLVQPISEVTKLNQTTTQPQSNP